MLHHLARVAASKPSSGPLLVVSCISVTPFCPTDPCNASDGARMSSSPEGMQEIQRMKSKLSLPPVILISCAQLHHDSFTLLNINTAVLLMWDSSLSYE